MRKKNGFTLMEVLVIVTIIAILSSAAISSFDRGRKKAKDTLIKTEINNSSRSAEIFYSKNNTFNGLCNEPEFADGGSIDQSITNNGGDFVCGDGNDGFCVSSTLNQGSSFCVDHAKGIANGFVCTGEDDILCN